MASNRRTEFPLVYAWGNNAKRATYKDRRCRVLARGMMLSVLIEFENGERTVTSALALRKPTYEESTYEVLNLWAGA